MKTNGLFIIITLLLVSIFSGIAQQANNSGLTQIATTPISYAEKITFYSKILNEKSNEYVSPRKFS